MIDNTPAIRGFVIERMKKVGSRPVHRHAEAMNREILRELEQIVVLCDRLQPFAVTEQTMRDLLIEPHLK